MSARRAGERREMDTESKELLLKHIKKGKYVSEPIFSICKIMKCGAWNCMQSPVATELKRAA